MTRAVRYRDIDRLSPVHSALDAPSILVRRHAVLLLLDPLRALVVADQLILIVPEGADKIMSVLDTYLKVFYSFLYLSPIRLTHNGRVGKIVMASHLDLKSHSSTRHLRLFLKL